MASAIGTQRRLQALAQRGWSATAIGGQGLGVSAAQAKRVMEQGGPVTPALAERVSAAYDVLWNRPPPQRTGSQREAARAAQRHADRQGWPPPLGWDDEALDDADAVPAQGWRRSGRATIPSAELAEDAEFVRQHGGHRSLNERAMRLGVSRDRLEHAYVRAGSRQAAGTEREAG